MNSIKTILIIEDNTEALLLYGEILRSENYEVFETTHGKEAIDFLKENTILPDLIIMDLTFPHMSAEEFVSCLKSHQDWKQVPILVISGHIDTEERSIALQANGCIKKPFDLEFFLAAVNRIINLKPDPHAASV